MSPGAALASERVGDRAGESSAARIELGLLGTFELSVAGDRVSLPMNGQRVLAFLALQGRALTRSFVAGSLWLDSTDDRALASLRSALWRLNREGQLVEASPDKIALAARTEVDFTAAVAQARRLLDPDCDECSLSHDLRLHEDLLPDWYDDWVAVERERFRQLRTHALERLCERLIAIRRFGEAIEAGLVVARAEPLRESAHHILIRAHLLEGNRGEALAEYERFRALLRDELGLAPSPDLVGLVADVTGR